MDPYEKLLSPCRNTRHSARVTRSKISSIGEKSGTGKQTQKDRAGAKEGEAISVVSVVVLYFHLISFFFSQRNVPMPK